MPVHHTALSSLFFSHKLLARLLALRDKEPCGSNKNAYLQFSLRSSSLEQLIMSSSFCNKFRLQSFLFF